MNDIAHDANIRLYCDDAFEILGQVVAILGEAGIKATVSIVEPSLEDAFALFVRGDEENGHG